MAGSRKGGVADGRRLGRWPELRGLLASPGFEGEPVKGVYFFPGESVNEHLYTTHPVLSDDWHWNGDPSSRARVIERMAAAHVNTVVMSYWSNMPQWSPMALDETSVRGVLEAIEGRPLVVMPALEGGFDRDHPEIAHWQFANDFPSPFRGGPLAPGLIWRIAQLCELFAGRMDLWARLYDRNGNARHAINIVHVCSGLAGTTDEEFAASFGQVAEQIARWYGVEVGFTIDAIAGHCTYVASPGRAGPVLERETSVLAIHGFVSEVWSDKVRNGEPCTASDWRACHPRDNNNDGVKNPDHRDTIESLADWKRATVAEWASNGLPVILDVSNGFDGRIVWAKAEQGTGFWGDNMVCTDDRWRNWVSQLKGPRVAGICFDTWNGYTEGYAAVPSFEHGDTVYEWLTDLLEPDPREYSHMHYADGVRTFRVYGAICKKWLELGADSGFGVPITNEEAAGHGRVSFFGYGTARSAIYWSASTDAHEVHGLIAQAYWDAGGPDRSGLGFPISDEEPNGTGRRSRFEHGQITWQPGDDTAAISFG